MGKRARICKEVRERDLTENEGEKYRYHPRGQVINNVEHWNPPLTRGGYIEDRRGNGLLLPKGQRTITQKLIKRQNQRKKKDGCQRVRGPARQPFL